MQLLAPGGSPAGSVFSRVGATTPSGLGDSSNLGAPYAFFDGAPASPTWGQGVAAVDTSTDVPSGPYRAATPGEVAGGGGAQRAA